jgi:aspartokinase
VKRAIERNSKSFFSIIGMLSMETITIQVSADLAQAYREAGLQQQQQIQNIVNDWLKILIQDQSLDNIIRELQEQANSNGLTSELLDEILLG